MCLPMRGILLAARHEGLDRPAIHHLNGTAVCPDQSFIAHAAKLPGEGRAGDPEHIGQLLPGMANVNVFHAVAVDPRLRFRNIDGNTLAKGGKLGETETGGKKSGPSADIAEERFKNGPVPLTQVKEEIPRQRCIGTLRVGDERDGKVRFRRKQHRRRDDFGSAKTFDIHRLTFARDDFRMGVSINEDKQASPSDCLARR